MQLKLDDEDDRIRRAVEESEAKRSTEESKKEIINKKVYGEMSAHRHKQVRTFVKCGGWHTLTQ